VIQLAEFDAKRLVVELQEYGISVNPNYLYRSIFFE